MSRSMSMHTKLVVIKWGCWSQLRLGRTVVQPEVSWTKREGHQRSSPPRHYYLESLDRPNHICTIGASTYEVRVWPMLDHMTCYSAIILPVTGVASKSMVQAPPLSEGDEDDLNGDPWLFKVCTGPFLTGWAWDCSKWSASWECTSRGSSHAQSLGKVGRLCCQSSNKQATNLIHPKIPRSACCCPKLQYGVHYCACHTYLLGKHHQIQKYLTLVIPYLSPSRRGTIPQGLLGR